MTFRNIIIQKVRQISGKNMLKNIMLLKTYGYIRKLKLRYRKIIWLDEIKENKILIKEKEKIISFPPLIFGESEKILEEEVPDTFIYKLENVYSTVSSSFSSVISIVSSLTTSTCNGSFLSVMAIMTV